MAPEYNQQVIYKILLFLALESSPWCSAFVLVTDSLGAEFYTHT